MKSNAKFAALIALGCCTAGLAEARGQAGAAYPVPGQSAAPPPSTGPRATSQANPGAERYDMVGYAATGVAGVGSRMGAAVVALASRDVPVGSMVEVTALDSGRTVLAVVTDRGPPRTDLIADLSAGAAAQLGVGNGAVIPIRIRSVVASAQDEAALKGGHAASARLDAPSVLLTGLRKMLPPHVPVLAASVAAPVPASSAPAPAKSAAVKPVAAPAPVPPAKPTVSRPAVSKPVVARPVVREGRYALQVGAFSNAANARALAAKLGGRVVAARGLNLVQLGPYPTRAAAEQARASVARRGYGGARIISR